MNKFIAATAALAALASPSFADGHLPTKGDAAAGEAQFNRQCVACHVVRDAAGETLAGRNSRVGPNLFGRSGSQIASADDFRYGDAIQALGESGRLWTEEAFVGYVQDPTGWLREELEDRRARGKMAYRVRDEDQAYDIYAFLATFAAE